MFTLLSHRVFSNLVHGLESPPSEWRHPKVIGNQAHSAVGEEGVIELDDDMFWKEKKFCRRLRKSARRSVIVNATVTRYNADWVTTQESIQVCAVRSFQINCQFTSKPCRTFSKWLDSFQENIVKISSVQVSYLQNFYLFYSNLRNSLLVFTKKTEATSSLSHL